MDGKQLNYSDGGEEERKLMQIASSGVDLSTFSEDLSGTMSSWPTEYHFSKKRHLVVRQFGIKAGDKVLELGAGCGSVTRYLAEIGAEVTSVEGTAARAAVNGKRCKDFPNVKVYVDNITQFETDEKFDWILMIGVLEYSPKYASTQNPPDEYLSIAKKLIKPNGKFVLAIENKLGIKYMNGASEDHNGKIFYEEAKPFDLEWITDSKVPLVWVLVRNITVAAREDFKIMTKVKLETIVNYVAKQLNVTVNDADILDAKKMEKIFGLNISKRERSDSLPLVSMLG
eukprot:gene34799-45011_t